MKVHMASRCFEFGHLREAEAFRTAFYRFLELNWDEASQPSGECRLRTEPASQGEMLTVVLWSEAALEQFVIFWDGFRRTHYQSGPSLIGR
ncbi:MAG TPA: hypothetical protein VIJ94_09035 [Caulobacteraceae bacterium]